MTITGENADAGWTTKPEPMGPGLAPRIVAELARLDDVARYLALHRIKSGPMVMVQKEGSGASQLPSDQETTAAVHRIAG